MSCGSDPVHATVPLKVAPPGKMKASLHRLVTSFAVWPIGGKDRRGKDRKQAFLITADAFEDRRKRPPRITGIQAPAHGLSLELLERGVTAFRTGVLLPSSHPHAPKKTARNKSVPPENECLTSEAGIIDHDST